ncbi:MAG: hypothetical protein P8X42_12940 [Calditrichaceae bacterium]
MVLVQFNLIAGKSTNEIEGLWNSTEETSSLFEPWAQKVALLIKKDSAKIFSARGHFLKNDESIADRKFINVKYDMTVHFQDTTQEPLNFVRADKNLENRLIYPRIPDYNWESHKNDRLRCGEGLSLLPRDMAKIGLLVLDDGKWQDEQIVSKEWIRESTKLHVQESQFFDYGYQWWHHPKIICNGGKNPMPDRLKSMI